MAKHDKISNLKKNIIFAIFLLLIVSIWFAYNAFKTNTNNLLPPENLQWSLVAAAFFCQILSYFLLIASWKLNLLANKVTCFRNAQIISQFGIAAIGKYAPGKIFGHLGRIGVASTISNNKGGLFVASFLEQFAMLHSGALIALYSFASANQILKLEVLSILLVPTTIYLINQIASSSEKLNYFNFICKIVKNINFSPFTWKRYSLFFLLFFINWLIASLVTLFTVMAYSPESTIEYSTIIFITTISYTAGFIAIFAPGGIGVREGAMITMLLPFLPLETSIFIASTHRVITITIDLILGVFSIYSISKNNE